MSLELQATIAACLMCFLLPYGVVIHFTAPAVNRRSRGSGVAFARLVGLFICPPWLGIVAVGFRDSWDGLSRLSLVGMVLTIASGWFLAIARGDSWELRYQREQRIIAAAVIVVMGLLGTILVSVSVLI